MRTIAAIVGVVSLAAIGYTAQAGASSWLAGVNGAKPGLIMEANPQVPDAYRQECLSGEAEDLAWVVARGGSVKEPVGSFHPVVRTLEFSPLEPAIVERKIYAPRV